MKAKLYIIFFIVVGVVGCQKESSSRSSDYLFELPEAFPPPVYEIPDVPKAKAIFELGRDLFYDPILSRDNSVSCGSCHKPFAAMADLDHKLSHGIDNQLGTRNAPGIFNLAWHNGFMHDGGVKHLDLIAFAPMTNPVEMDEDLQNVLNKLRTHSVYSERFQQIFGREVASNDMFEAFTRFMGLMISADSRYDQWVRGKEGVQLNEKELAGLEVFRAKCESCHSEPLFSDFNYYDIGLDMSPEDPGRGQITLEESDHGKFKTPSLRNIELTAPYMHDGRFNTLKQVLDFISEGTQNSVNLDPSLKHGETLGIPLKEIEKDQLLAFMATLSDKNFTKDPRFQEP
jgi:cytochrome c peroxidase